jgi:hypothetical protein
MYGTLNVGLAIKILDKGHTKNCRAFQPTTLQNIIICPLMKHKALFV